MWVLWSVILALGSGGTEPPEGTVAVEGANAFILASLAAEAGNVDPRDRDWLEALIDGKTARAPAKPFEVRAASLSCTRVNALALPIRCGIKGTKDAPVQGRRAWELWTVLAGARIAGEGHAGHGTVEATAVRCLLEPEKLGGGPLAGARCTMVARRMD